MRIFFRTFDDLGPAFAPDSHPSETGLYAESQAGGPLHRNRTPRAACGVLLAALLVLPACSGESEKQEPYVIKANNAPNPGSRDASNAGDEDGASDASTPEDRTDADRPDIDIPPEVTYHAHIRPLIATNCTECHVQGGIAPFTLNTYDEVAPLAESIAMSVEERSMPPWLPSPDCGEFQHERGLSEQEIALFQAWAATGAEEGDPASVPEIQPPDVVELGEPDWVLDPGFSYKPTPVEGTIDDYHCFVVDPELEETVYLNAFETQPGNASIVHHMLLFAVGKDKLPRINELDAESPDIPGYTCFGGTRTGGDNLLGGWVPGAVPLQFDPGAGIEIPKDSVLVMQVHYNTLNDSEGSDRTTVDLHFTEGRARTKLAMFPLADLQLNVAAGDEQGEAGFSIQNPAPIPLQIYGVVPHMHLLGKHISVTLERPNPDDNQCLIDIPRWDFNWQNFYLFEEPIDFGPNDVANLYCAYDNSMANNMRFGRTPRDLSWGEGTYDEMCLAYIIVRDPR